MVQGRQRSQRTTSLGPELGRHSCLQKRQAAGIAAHTLCKLRQAQDVGQRGVGSRTAGQRGNIILPAAQAQALQGEGRTAQ